MELRHFDKEDWYAYAGCESADPLIAHHKEFTLVVDDTYVEVYLPEAGSKDAKLLLAVRLTGNLAWKFPDCGTAMLFALDIRGSESSDIMFIKAAAYGGRNVV